MLRVIEPAIGRSKMAGLCRFAVLCAHGASNMITDIFARRYDDVLTFDLHWAQSIIGPALMHAAQSFFDDLQPVLRLPNSFFQKLNQKLARELAVPALSPHTNITQLQVCSSFLANPYHDFMRFS
jgi:hypothetical protein